MISDIPGFKYIISAIFIIGLGTVGVLAYNGLTGDDADIKLPALSISGTPSAELTATEQQSLMTKLMMSDNFGDAATITLVAYDRASDSNTVVTTSINASVWNKPFSLLDEDWDDMGNTFGVKIKDKDSYSAGDSTVTTVSIGDKVSVYPMDAGYYCDPKRDVIIDKAQVQITLDCWQASTDANMDIQGYDQTGSTQLSGPTNYNISTADISIGANGEKLVYLELTNNHPDRVRDVCAVGIIQQNKSKSATLSSLTHKTGRDDVLSTIAVDCSGKVPEHMASVAMNSTEINENWEKACVFGSASTPVAARLMEYQTLKAKIAIKADSVIDPVSQTGVNGYQDGSVWAFTFKDCAWSEDRNGYPVYGFYEKNTDSENDVGVDEADANTGGATLSGTSNADGIAYGIEGI